MPNQNLQQSLKQAIDELVALSAMEPANRYPLASAAMPVRFRTSLGKRIFDNLFCEYSKPMKDAIAEGGYMGAEVRLYLSNHPEAVAKINTLSVMGGIDSVHTWAIAQRFEISGGSIFSMTDPLVERILDMDAPADNLPSYFFAPPLAHCYIEFGSAENRTDSPLVFVSPNGLKVIVDGVYINEYEQNYHRSSKEMREHFGITKDSRHRRVDVGFSASPLSFAGYREFPYSLFLPNLKYYTIVIDDDCSLKDNISANINWYANRSDFDKPFFTTLLNFLTNAFLYIGLENRVEKRIQAPSKPPTTTKSKGKMYKSLSNESLSYTRIQIGSTTEYRPLSVVAAESREQGAAKRPHVRRGYFGVRHTKIEGQITPKITRVKPTIIHRELLESDVAEMLLRTYDVM